MKNILWIGSNTNDHLVDNCLFELREGEGGSTITLSDADGDGAYVR